MYNPTIEIDPSLTLQRRQFRRWLGKSERVTLVNLVDRKGGQGRLGKVLEEVCRGEGVEVGWFDFHDLTGRQVRRERENEGRT